MWFWEYPLTVAPRTELKSSLQKKGTRFQEHADSLENLVPFGKLPSYANRLNVN